MMDPGKAINYVLLNEGGFSNRKADLGGKTNFGITQTLLDKVRPGTIVENLTPPIASEIYEEVFVTPLRLKELTSQLIATCILDVAVNTGPHEAGTCAQLALGYSVTDGIIGTKTIEQLNAVTDEIGWLRNYLVHLTDYYMGRCAMNSSQYSNLRGWLDRALRMIVLLEPVQSP